ncbi:MAG TPA: FGGY-family carbohydrate kinase [Acidobacteriaceae bacterium]|nr:FGGY-family carbohydrate kinase [Acidobacteriaceae bacterium]
MSTGPALVAIDLGAESCRLSLLQWSQGKPSITMLRRIPHEVIDHGVNGLRWDFDRICAEIEAGLRVCAGNTKDPIQSIGVTGWAVDYVRLDTAGNPIAQPYSYRDPRTTAAMEAVHKIIPAADLYATTGIQIQPINTIYQLYADKLSGAPISSPWVNLPEYVLHRLGAPLIAEYTNATHTGLINAGTRTWSDKIFAELGLDASAAPDLVSPGTVLGPLRGALSNLPAFAGAQLIAPACHDTASAVAGIPAHSSGTWAYLSSGTWSLMGMVLPAPILTPQACRHSFTNLGFLDDKIMFHRGMHGMWLLRQCLNTWDQQREWNLSEIIAEASQLPGPDGLLDLEDPSFSTPGDMAARINQQREQHGLPALPRESHAAPRYANLIFHSLARRYAALLDDLTLLTRQRPEALYVVGGGARNEYLHALTANALGIPVHRCSVESSTLGNFAIQWARIENPSGPLDPQSVAAKASTLATVEFS